MVKQKNQRLEQIETVTRKSSLQVTIQRTFTSFKNRDTQPILDIVNEIASDPVGEQAAESLLAFYKLYLTNRREQRRDQFQTVFQFEVKALQEAIKLQYNFDQDLGSNLAAAVGLASRFKDVILPLYNSLRGEAGFKAKVESFNNSEMRARIIQYPEVLGEQRDLTEDEQ
jgi:hypothetical protein